VNPGATRSGGVFDVATLEAREKELLEQSSKPEFWDRPEAAQTVLKYACAVVPFVALAPLRKSALLELKPTYVPAEALDQVRSLIGLVPPFDPTYVQFAGFVVIMFRVQLRFALMVNVGPTSATVAPTSTWSAVGDVRDVVVVLMASLTSAPIVTDAVLVVLQLPALPLH